MPTVVVRGLREAAENLRKIGAFGATDLSRKALRDAADVIVSKVRGSTYTTFQRRTGFIKSGFGAVVAKDLRSGLLRAWIMQREQSLAGSSATAKAQRAAYLPKAKGGKQKLFNVAYWWRFLEFGTHGRRNVRAPAFLRKLKAVDFKGKVWLRNRQLKALDRYNKGKSLKDLPAKPWVRPAFGASATGAIAEFGTSFRMRVDAEIQKLPKK
jgi:hypothetical protein